MLYFHNKVFQWTVKGITLFTTGKNFIIYDRVGIIYSGNDVIKALTEFFKEIDFEVFIENWENTKGWYFPEMEITYDVIHNW